MFTKVPVAIPLEFRGLSHGRVFDTFSAAWQSMLAVGDIKTRASSASFREPSLIPFTRFYLIQLNTLHMSASGQLGVCSCPVPINKTQQDLLFTRIEVNR